MGAPQARLERAQLSEPDPSVRPPHRSPPPRRAADPPHCRVPHCPPPVTPTPSFPDYPFESHWHVHRDGLRQHYLDEGRGPVVLMLHGNPTWSYYWRHLVLALRGTHRCIVPDHIGMGLSDKPDAARYPFSLARRVDDLERLMDALGAPRGITLAVHDWGGMIGFAWACRHPERIARLVILNTAAFPLPVTKKLPWLLKIGRDWPLGEWLILRHNAFARGATHLAVTRRLPRAEREAYTAPYDTPAHRLATLRFVQDIPLGPPDPGFELVQATARAVPGFADRPTLIGWGMKDFVFDHHFLTGFRRMLPGAEVHEYPDAGHYVLEDARERLVPAVVAFLARHPAPA